MWTADILETDLVAIWIILEQILLVTNGFSGFDAPWEVRQPQKSFSLLDSTFGPIGVEDKLSVQRSLPTLRWWGENSK